MKKRLKKKRINSRFKPYEFSFDLRRELIRVSGVDLTLLPGIGLSTALTMISETGLDMTRWHSEKQFCSWLGLAPNNKISGGKLLSSRSKKTKSRAALALRMGVSSLYRDTNDTALGAFLKIKRSQLGSSTKAITAGANKLARMYYQVMLKKINFVEYGAQKYYEMQKIKYLRRVRRTVRQWGFELIYKEQTPITESV